jgi:hypothetical protein
MPRPLLKIWNEENRPFYVRLLLEGDEYGLNNCLIHDGEPILEFYDASEKHGPRGQFVSRYYVSTLSESPSRAHGHGLSLYGGEPVWHISAANITDALIYAAAFTK